MAFRCVTALYLHASLVLYCIYTPFIFREIATGYGSLNISEIVLLAAYSVARPPLDHHLIICRMLAWLKFPTSVSKGLSLRDYAVAKNVFLHSILHSVEILVWRKNFFHIPR